MEREVSEEGIQDLARSIEAVGVIEPLVVTSHDGKYFLNAGKRRLKAAVVAGLVTVPCIVIDADHEKALAISLHENLFREKLNPVDEARMYAYLRDTLSYSGRKIADMVRKGEAYVSQRLQILMWPPNLSKALQGDQISFSVARELAQIKDAKHRSFLLDHAIKGGANYRAVRKWRQDHEASTASVAKDSDFVQANHEPPPQAPQLVHCYWCGQQFKPEEIKWVPLCIGDIESMDQAKESEEKE